MKVFCRLVAPPGTPLVPSWRRSRTMRLSILYGAGRISRFVFYGRILKKGKKVSIGRRRGNTVFTMISRKCIFGEGRGKLSNK